MPCGAIVGDSGRSFTEVRLQSLIEAYSISSIHFTIFTTFHGSNVNYGCTVDTVTGAGTQQPWRRRGWVSECDLLTFTDTHSDKRGHKTHTVLHTEHNIIDIVLNTVYTAQYMLKTEEKVHEQMSKILH